MSMKVEHFQSGNKKGQHSKTLPERMKLEFIFLRQEECSFLTILRCLWSVMPSHRSAPHTLIIVYTTQKNDPGKERALNIS